MTSIKITDGNLTTLDKDGISDELYQLLWARDELNFGPSVNIPDTIVYKYGQPVVWYFTSVNGKVRKKNKHNLISAKIEEVFNKHVMGYDVLAMFISMAHDSNETNATQNHQTTIQYLDRAALNNFLYNRKKDMSGILQRFIEPKSTHNEIVRAIWSPKVCLLERAENKHQLHDHRYGLYERCVIYEGPEYYFTSAPLRGPVLSGQLQKLCEQVVAHIAEVTFGQRQVSRMVLNFKVDSRDKVWLLYSTSIRCIDMLDYTSPAAAAVNTQRNLVNIDSVVSLSDKVHLNPKLSYEKIVPKRRIRCLSCTRETLEDMRHPVTYKSIIKHYDHVLFLLLEAGKAEGTTTVKPDMEDAMISWPPDSQIVEAAGGVGFGCLYITDTGELLTAQQIGNHIKPRRVGDLLIPPILHNIHYKLSLKSYKKCKHDPLFLYKTCLVCEACYLVYAEFTTMLLRMGQDLTKLLTPDPSAVKLQQTAASLDRPSSADWRALSTTGGAGSQQLMKHSTSAGGLRQPSRAGQLRPSANHLHAKKSAIGIRSSETIRQPSVPSSHRLPINHNSSMSMLLGGSSGEVKLGGTVFAESLTSPSPQLQQQQQQQLLQQKRSLAAPSGGSPVRGGALEHGSTSLYDAEEVRQTIAQRERHFFKEVSLNPNLKDQHPLMHLITAQEKLRLVEEQSGVVMSKTANKSESIFGTRYGRQTGDKYNQLGAYKVENPYVISGEVVLPSVLKMRTKERMRQKKLQKERSLRALLNPDESLAEQEKSETDAAAAAGGGGGGGGSSVKSAKSAKSIASDPNVKSSVRHREFLAATLRRLEGEAEDAADFKGSYTGSLDEPSPSRKVKKSNSVGSGMLSAGSGHSSKSGGGGADGGGEQSKSSQGTASRNGSSAAADAAIAEDLHTLGSMETNESGMTEGSLMRKWGMDTDQKSLASGGAAGRLYDPIQEALERRRVLQEAKALMDMSSSKYEPPALIERTLSAHTTVTISSVERPIIPEEEEERSRSETPTQPTGDLPLKPQTPLSRGLSYTLNGDAPQFVMRSPSGDARASKFFEQNCLSATDEAASDSETAAPAAATAPGSEDPSASGNEPVATAATAAAEQKAESEGAADAVPMSAAAADSASVTPPGTDATGAAVAAESSADVDDSAGVLSATAESSVDLDELALASAAAAAAAAASANGAESGPVKADESRIREEALQLLAVSAQDDEQSQVTPREAAAQPSEQATPRPKTPPISHDQEQALDASMTASQRV